MCEQRTELGYTKKFFIDGFERMALGMIYDMLETFHRWRCLRRSELFTQDFFFVSGTNRIKSNSNQTFTDSELVSFSGFRLQWIDFFLLNSSCGWFETCYLINTITGSLLVAFFIYSSSLDNAI